MGNLHRPRLIAPERREFRPRDAHSENRTLVCLSFGSLMRYRARSRHSSPLSGPRSLYLCKLACGEEGTVGLASTPAPTSLMPRAPICDLMQGLGSPFRAMRVPIAGPSNLNQWPRTECPRPRG